MSLAQKIVITIIVVLLVVTLGGMILGRMGVGSLPTNGSRLGTTPQIGVTTPSTGKEVTNEVPATGTTEMAGTKETATTRLVIKTGELNIVVKNVVDSAKKIIQYAQKRGGWIIQSNIQEIETLPIANVVVRIPVGDFDEAITYIRGLAVKVNYEKSEGQDVTEEYVDLESRLRNLEATEKQFLEIMKKATKIEDILRVQSEISRIRGEIEQTKGRILFLERSAKMATITVNLALSEELLPIPPAEKWRPGYVAKTVWKNVMAAWRNISYAVITFFVYAALWVPIAVIVYAIIWWIRRPKKEKK